MPMNMDVLRGIGGAPSAMPAEPGESEAMENETAADETAEGEAPTPEEQAIYDKMVNGALQTLFGQREADTIAFLRETPDDKTDGASALLAQTLAGLDQSYRRSKGSFIPDDVLVGGGVNIMEALLEATQKALSKPRAPVTLTDQEKAGALINGFMLWMQSAEGYGRDITSFKADWDKVIEADRAGTLDQMFPELAEFAGQGSLSARANVPPARPTSAPMPSGPMAALSGMGGMMRRG